MGKNYKKVINECKKTGIIKDRNTNIYIMSLEAKFIAKDMLGENKYYDSNKRKASLLYGASLPLSLDVQKLYSIANDGIFIKNDLYYTNDIINVSFTKSLSIKREDADDDFYSKKELRDYLYENGCRILLNDKSDDIVDYVMYKRSSSKARSGSILMIKKELYDEMIKWSRMGMEFVYDEVVDYASLKAYESLTLSSIIGNVKIKPSEILLVNDVSTVFKSRCSCLYQNKIELTEAEEDEAVEQARVKKEERIKAARNRKNGNKIELTQREKDNVKVKDGETDKEAQERVRLKKEEKVIENREKEVVLTDKEKEAVLKGCLKEKIKVSKSLYIEDKEEENKYDIWDGMALADESLFNELGLSDKSTILLRQRFLKTNAINTKVQEYFMYKFGDKYESQMLFDLCGNRRKASNVRLILTSNSLKILKFSYKFESKQACYKAWLDSLKDNGSMFGICKHEKKSHLMNGEYNRLSYQMVNSMNFSYDEIKELTQEELDYINKLKHKKDDNGLSLAVFKDYLGENNTKVITDSNGFDKVIDYKDRSDKNSMMVEMLNINYDLHRLQFFKDYRARAISSMLDDLKVGRIKVKNMDYRVLAGNVFEFLEYASLTPHKRETFVEDCLSDGEGDIRPIKGDKLYCPVYNDGEKVVLMRNPHIFGANCILGINTSGSLLNKWFNLSNNIIAVDGTENDWSLMGNGYDLDSDTVISSDNDIIINKVEDIYKLKDEKELFLTPVPKIEAKNTKRYYNVQHSSEVDHAISENLIGIIVDLSMVLESYLWDKMANGCDDELLKCLNDGISMLSSLSGIEIDKAKKTVDNLKMRQVIGEIKCRYLNDMKVEYGSNKQVRPLFMKKTCNSKGSRKFFNYEKLKTPMDFITDVIKNEVRTADSITGELSLHEIFYKSDSTKINSRHRNTVETLLKELNEDIKAIYATKNDGEENENTRFRLINDCVEKVGKVKISNRDTMIAIIDDAMDMELAVKRSIQNVDKEIERIEKDLLKANEDELIDKLDKELKLMKNEKLKHNKVLSCNITALEILFKAHKQLFLKCIIPKDLNKGEVIKLERDNKGEFALFCNNYAVQYN